MNGKSQDLCHTSAFVLTVDDDCSQIPKGVMSLLASERRGREHSRGGGLRSHSMTEDRDPVMYCLLVREERAMTLLLDDVTVMNS